MYSMQGIASVGIALLTLWGRGQLADAVTAKAEFQEAGSPVKGTVTFSQVDPTERVRIGLNLEGLKEDTKWGINAFPVMSDCSTPSVGNIYNPTKAMPGTSCPDGTPKAMCLAGDMAAKHGGLKAQDGDKVFYDETLSLYGAYSLIYRSVVLSDKAGVPYACATITGTKPIITLQAHFEPAVTGLEGSIWMIQEAEDPTADTIMLIDLVAADKAEHSNMTFHVHEGSLLSPSTPCSSLKYHYNPTNAEPCTRDPAQWNKCELGDISGRHGSVSLPATREARLFMTDTFLPLSGPNSMSGRSIVMHEGETGKRFGCAALLEVPHVFYKSAASAVVPHNATGRAMRADGQFSHRMNLRRD